MYILVDIECTFFRLDEQAAFGRWEIEMRDYEFHIYDADAVGRTSVDARIEVMTCSDDRAAKTVGRAFAKSGTGPVDIARKGGLPWNDRYIITAARHDLASKRVTMERLD